MTSTNASTWYPFPIHPPTVTSSPLPSQIMKENTKGYSLRTGLRVIKVFPPITRQKLKSMAEQAKVFSFLSPHRHW